MTYTPELLNPFTLARAEDINREWNKIKAAIDEAIDAQNLAYAPFFGTFDEAINARSVGEYFTSDASGELATYRRISTAPLYEVLAESAWPLGKGRLAEDDGDTLVGSDDGAAGAKWTTMAGFKTYLRSSAGASILGYLPSGDGAVARFVSDKLRERVSIFDYGAVDGGILNAPVAVALTALGAVNPIQLILPKGSYTVNANADWSANRNVTFVIEPGVSINHGAFNITFPERVEVSHGVSFIGTGLVTQANAAAVAMVTPPSGYVHAGNVSRGLKAGGGALGRNNHFDGYASGEKASGVIYGNIGIGAATLRNLTGGATGAAAFGSPFPVASANIGIGDTSLTECTTGYENLGIGALTLQQIRDGRWNVALGSNSQILNQSGECNNSVGAYALVTSSSNNCNAFGWSVMENHVNGSNTAMGHVALGGSVTSTRNTAIGSLCMQFCEDGYDNLAAGHEALKNAVHPQQCVALGSFSLGQTNGTPINDTGVGHNALLALTTGISNTALGTGALAGLTTFDNCFGIGVSAAVTASNQGQLGNSNVTVYAYGAVQNRSDLRDKTDVRDTVLGLDFILALRPVDFRWDMREDYRRDPPQPPKLDMPNEPKPPVEPIKPAKPVNPDGTDLEADDPRLAVYAFVLAEYEAALADYPAALAAYEIAMAEWTPKAEAYDAAMADYATAVSTWAEAQKLGNIQHDGSKKRSRFHHGLIAQEVRDVLIAKGIDFGGYQDHTVNGGDDVLSIGYEELIAPLIKAVQELSARVVALEGGAA